MSSQTDPSDIKASPVIYVRPAAAGQASVGRLIQRTPDRELLIDFGSEPIVARQQDLRHHGIETVQEGGVRQQFLADPDGFASAWHGNMMTTVMNLLEAAPGALRLGSIRLEAQASGLLDRQDEAGWDRLVGELRKHPGITVLELSGAEHVAITETASDGRDAAPTAAGRADERNGNSPPDVLEYLRRGQPQTLEAASKQLVEQTPASATEEVLRSLQECLSDDEMLSPRLFARLKKLVAASKEWPPFLLEPVLTSSLNSIDTHARTDRRELAEALVSVIGPWTELDASSLEEERIQNQLIDLLRIAPTPKAWTPTGPRVSIISALAQRSEMTGPLSDPSIWRRVSWNALVKMLTVAPVAQLLARAPLRDEVLRAAVITRTSSKDRAALRFADLVTAPEPLQEFITADQISKLLLVMERQSPQLAEALMSRERLAVSRAEPEILASTTARSEAELAKLKSELESHSELIVSLRTTIQELESQLTTTTQQLREEIDRPRRETALAGERVEAQARQAQIDAYRALGDLLSSLEPKAQADASVKTLLATHRRRAEDIGLIGFGTPGDQGPFDPARHESVDAPSATVRVRTGGYEIAGSPPTVVTKAVVEAP